MVGGGNRRDEGSFSVNNTNGFAALESLRRKKKSEKGKGASKAVGKSKSKEADVEEPKVFWAPAPLTVKSWADVEDDDDDDFYATTAPPQATWGAPGLSKIELPEIQNPVEESESEDELLDDVDDEMEEDHEEEVLDQPETIIMQKSAELPLAPKVAERQLSKKEKKKKELAELEAILADFRVELIKEKPEESPDAIKERKDEELNGDADKKEPVLPESKTVKKKKKKDKAPKELKEPQNLFNGSDFPEVQEENVEAEQLDEDASAVDVKVRLKKVLSSKKKKSNRDTDAAARAASMEAAARSAKLAAAKKKEKNHYNQQPTR